MVGALTITLSSTVARELLSLHSSTFLIARPRIMLLKSNNLARLSATVVAAALLFTVAACDDSTGPQAPASSLFVLNAGPTYSTAQLRIDQINVGQPMAFWQVGGAFRIRESTPDQRTFTFRNGSDTAALASLSLVVPRDSTFLLIMTQRAVGGGIVLLKDDVPAIAEETALIRIVNASPSAGPVDVYVLGSTEPLADAPTPTFSGVDYEGVTARLPYTPPTDSVRVVVTAAGTKDSLSSVRYSTVATFQELGFSKRTANTVILLNDKTTKTLPVKQFVAGGL